MELEKCGVQDPASAIATAAEFLIDFKREFWKGRCKKTHEDSDGERYRDNSPKRDRDRCGTKAMTRRRKHQRSTDVSFAMCLIRFSSPRSMVNLGSCHGRRKARRGREDPIHVATKYHPN